MGANVLSEFFKSQEDRERLKQVEQLRRKGHSFIRVRYNGPQYPMIDSEGQAYNIRIHGLRDVEAFEKTDISTGKTDWQSRPGSKVLVFRQSASGDIEADIWDDPDYYNRHFIATHPELQVLDSALAKEIKELLGKPFKVELSESEMLEREIEAKKRELESLKKREGTHEEKAPQETAEEVVQKPTQEVAPKGGRPKGAKDRKPRTRRRVKRGVNKPTPSVDSSGVSRVATRGSAEGHPAAVQPSTQAPEHSGEGTESTV